MTAIIAFRNIGADVVAEVRRTVLLDLVVVLDRLDVGGKRVSERSRA